MKPLRDILNATARALLMGQNDMRYILQIKRQKEPNSDSYWQTIEYNCEDGENETIATVLRAIENGKLGIEPISWECSCLQKKCGACAMIIDGKPRLACDFFLKNHKGKNPIIIEPLRKFPVVRDLIVDRSVMRDNLKKLNAWMEKEAAVQGEKKNELMYDASRCLQCGCCLEVCPNYCSGDEFYGAAGAVPMARIMNGNHKNDADIKKNYNEHIYKGCGKSLACLDICPAKIKTDRMLSSSNALAFWKK
jgi:succinate dehydrogenase / fumarate reductase iron-sulfur subunit